MFLILGVDEWTIKLYLFVVSIPRTKLNIKESQGSSEVVYFGTWW